MLMRFALFLTLFLAACSRTDEGAIKVQWVELADVTTECSDGSGREAGCYKWNGDTCYIYTRVMKSEFDRAVIAAAGHELVHCVKGEFHVAGSY
ncbi:MAG: hypothetical protein U1E51_07660 [Candidatus Binatia bacterium]|nr:hypothetical protein [Candidatus Binatia bacterium]